MPPGTLLVGVPPPYMASQQHEARVTGTVVPLGMAVLYGGLYLEEPILRKVEKGPLLTVLSINERFKRLLPPVLACFTLLRGLASSRSWPAFPVLKPEWQVILVYKGF